jgi:hypothetical protein
MGEETAKVTISLGDTTLEFSGSEVFVQKQIDEFKALIHSKQIPVKPVKPLNPPALKNKDNTGDSSFAAYPNVIDYDGETIHILKVGGGNKADKTRNLALIYGWAKKQLGIDEIPNKEFIQICVHHECFDESNFKTYLKKAPSIILKGSPKNYVIRLSAPGLQKAKDLIESLNQES